VRRDSSYQQDLNLFEPSRRIPMSQERAVIFDLETVPDLTVGRELLKADAEVSDGQVRRLLQRYARPGEDPDNAFVKVPLQRIVCIGAIYAERSDGGHGLLLAPVSAILALSRSAN
jgi:hypothetical protein